MELPEAGGASATGCVMIRPTPMRGQSLPDARWADPLPEAAQTLMASPLSDIGAQRYVGRRPLGVGGDFAVLAVLIDFQAEAKGPGAAINLRMDVRLVCERDATVISMRTITAKARAATAKGDVVAAFEQTTGQTMQAFAAWLLGSVSDRS